MNELMSWIKANDYNHHIEHLDEEDNNVCLVLDAPASFADNISSLLETIILEKNQVAMAHARLREILSNIVFEPGKNKIARLVEQYISECDYLNLEGFVTFRLSDYSHKVDLVMYAAIKNALTFN